MPLSLSAGVLFDFHRDKLALEWLAGRAGEGRVINLYKQPPVINPSVPLALSVFSRASANGALVGYLNLIYPNRIQVLGVSELSYLAGLGKNSHEDALRQLFDSEPVAVIIADKQHGRSRHPASGDTGTPLCVASEKLVTELAHHAEHTGTPLLASPLSGEVLINHLQYYLANFLVDKVILHGVFMEVLGIGVLLTGDSGVGKSELALELVSRGNRLIADDSPEFSRIAPDTLNGTCPALLRDFLEVRGLGVLNIRAMFGDSAIKNNKYLRLIIHLKQMSDEDLRNMDRLQGNHSMCRILEVDVPQTSLPVAPGRNLAVLVEGAVRNHILSFSGYGAANDFAERQRQHMAQN